jgi:hypothetical protein
MIGSTIKNHFAIGEGIGNGLQEVILTTNISEFLFDHDVEDVALAMPSYVASTRRVGRSKQRCFLQSSLQNTTIISAQ